MEIHLIQVQFVNYFLEKTKKVITSSIDWNHFFPTQVNNREHRVYSNQQTLSTRKSLAFTRPQPATYLLSPIPSIRLQLKQDRPQVAAWQHFAQEKDRSLMKLDWCFQKHRLVGSRPRRSGDTAGQKSRRNKQKESRLCIAYCIISHYQTLE